MKTTWLLFLLSASVASTATAQPNGPVPAPGNSALSKKLTPLATSQTAPPPFPGFQAMHAEFLLRFEESPGFGRSRIMMPRFRAPLPALVLIGSNGPAYLAVSPDLVGLEDDPQVYVPRSHAIAFNPSAVRMADGSVITTNSTRSELRKQFKKRALTAQETNAVLALREGQDLVVITNRVTLEHNLTGLGAAPELLVMGALRAGATCAQCHQCAEKTLLGAFSYSLTPVIPQANYSNATTRISSSTDWVVSLTERANAFR